MRIVVLAVLVVLVFAVVASAATHQAVLTWTLSVDDTVTACTAPSTCTQDVYRAPGACSATSAFVTLAGVAATATTYTDTTIVPGTWCYAVAFAQNGVESAKDTVTVTLLPSPPTGLGGTAQ